MRVLPHCAVGDDAEGKSLLAEMRAAGMDHKYARMLPRARTMFSVCYQFPDQTGGNLTESNSASGDVSPAMIRAARSAVDRNCLAVALPEVPLASRVELLRLTKRQRGFTAASFVSHEMPVVRREKLLNFVDVLSINTDEAAALAGISPRKSPRQIVEACRRLYPQLRLCMTAGEDGLFSHDGECLPALKVKVVNTAGAGDAALAGLIVGVLTGQVWSDCLRLGRLLSAMSITSADTIHFGINLKSLRTFNGRQPWPLK
jgi:sugar/nucleoside kinase (ribokinase family)